jgi:spore coat protein CotF
MNQNSKHNYMDLLDSHLAESFKQHQEISQALKTVTSDKVRDILKSHLKEVTQHTKDIVTHMNELGFSTLQTPELLR